MGVAKLVRKQNLSKVARSYHESAKVEDFKQTPKSSDRLKAKVRNKTKVINDAFTYMHLFDPFMHSYT